jgi:hypothetical protein
MNPVVHQFHNFSAQPQLTSFAQIEVHPFPPRQTQEEKKFAKLIKMYEKKKNQLKYLGLH